MTELQPFDLQSAPLDRGTVLLEASAGTGKTYTLVGLLLRLLLEGHIERLEQGLVVTFTIAATEELKTRLRAALEQTLCAVHGAPADPLFTRLAALDGAEPRLRAALDDFDRAPIATIHGFCKRLLDEAAFESRQPFQLDFVVDTLPLLHRAAADVLRSRYASTTNALGAVLYQAGLTPKVLVQLHRLWRRYPDVQIEPTAPDSAPFLALLEPLLTNAAALYDDAVHACLLNLAWLANQSPFVGKPEQDLARLATQLRDEPLMALPLLVALAPSIATVHLKKSSAFVPHAFFDCLDELAAATTQAAEHLRAELLHEMDERMSRDKLREHLLSFDDLLQRTHAALHDPARRPILLAALRERYQVALIDEFQDTDSLQYEIFAQCFAQRPLFLIGDPKQAIYGFRGADLQTYLLASNDAIERCTLGTNYRSAPALVNAVSQLFAHSHAFLQQRIKMPAVAAKAGQSELRLQGDELGAFCWRLVPSSDKSPMAKADAESLIARDIAAEASRLLGGAMQLDGRRPHPRDIAVLTRTNKQAVLVQEALRAAGIASAIGKAGDIFETEELIELERVLRAVLQPGDLLRARGAMSTRLWGKDAEWLAQSVADDQLLDEELRRLGPWRQLWIRRGFVVMAEQLLVDLNVATRLLTTRGGERALTNFLQLFELLHHAEHERRLSPEGLLEWLQHERRHKEDLDYQLRELRLESDEDAVQILTVHGSKGLEYEIVFCPFLWDSRRVDGPGIVPGTPRRLSFDLQGVEQFAAEVERLAEDLRLCYVAVTRARRRCYVHVGNLGNTKAGARRSALAWLLLPQQQQLDLIASPEDFATWAEDAKAGILQLPTHLATLCAATAIASGDERAMTVAIVPDEPTAQPVPAIAPPALRPPQRATRHVRPRTLHSFSSLIAGTHDLDAAPDVADPAVATDHDPLPQVPLGIFAFARGARAGLCLHTLLEHADLQDLSNAATEPLVQRTLADYGLLDASAHHGPIEPVADVLQNLRDLAAATVHAGGPTVAELCRGPRAIEWKFTLPTKGSDLRALAQLFATHGSALAKRYAPRLRRLPQHHLRGFLTGFVDLLTTHEGRHWVLDWKSNHLGDRRSDYGEEQLAAAMMHSDYVLQYHLYVLALHRQLRARLGDYDYDRHMGGVCYAFLRGAAPGQNTGMLYDRVPLALVQAMHDWAEGTR